MATLKLKRNLWLTGLVVTALTTSCTKKDDAEEAAEDDDTSSVSSPGGDPITQVNDEINRFANAYPSSLALSVFPSKEGAALRLGDAEVEDPNAHLSVKEKVEANQEKLKGEGDCLNVDVLMARSGGMGDITCYEFDSDMNPMKVADDVREFGTVNGKHSNGEACMVAFARDEVKDSVQIIDQAMELAGALVCQAKKKGLDKVLGISESIDLADAFEDVGDGKVTISKASIARLDNAADASAVYLSEISVESEDGQSIAVKIRHNPNAAGGESGTLWFERSRSGANLADVVAAQPVGAPTAVGPAPGGGDPNNSANKVEAMSIAYAREVAADGSSQVSFEVRRAQIVNSIEPFDADGLVNYAALPEDAQNDQVHAIQYVAYSGNPETNEGDLSYWMNPGGNYNESARGFLFHIEADSDGALGGCGISGATANVSIRKALIEPSEDNMLAPVRYWHPRENQNISPDKDARYTANEGFFITEQCFKQNVETGLYEIGGASLDEDRGYAVIETEATSVLPPPPPPQLEAE